MTKFKDISVVVHGPVMALPDRDMEQGITQKALASVRQHLPGATLILSTWEGQDLSGLEADLVQLNRDPGPNIIAYDRQQRPLRENNNRQIVAVVEGLKRVTTPYAVKLRSDNYLRHSGFIGLQAAYPIRHDSLRLFDERLVVAHKYTKMASDGYPIVRHLCDYFAYGRTTDLLRLWDIPLLTDFPLDPAIKGRGQYAAYPNRLLSTEQAFVNLWLTKLHPDTVSITHHFQNSEALQREWELVLANNFVVAEAHNLGLKTVHRLKSHTVRANEMDHPEWQMLYNRYCDPLFLPPTIEYKFGSHLYRKLKSPFERLKHAIKRKDDFAI